ncbi:hypothetical protein PRZ48_004843 [Zasmidium cellare]|uniref:Uncharacterized protein n=1 Tax=Zasmidium cellare TaxID=395010 RepID=A0ABR0ERV8_ZASCE|nr:hypothetical protein PRZ48_004843 [Zasmidium cellare]
MPPTASKKGTQGKSSKQSDRRSASRHSTPVSALTDTSPPTPRTATPSTNTGASMATETAYLHTSTAALISSEPSIEALIDKTNASGSKPGDPPVARDLQGLHDKIRDSVNRFMTKRGEVCDRSMRQLVQRRKERAQVEREQEAARAEAERAKIKREEDDKRKEKKTPSKKRSHDEMDIDEDAETKVKKESLPNVGAHGLARQDGVGVDQGQNAPPSPPVQPGTVAPDLMDTADSNSDSGDSHAEAPSTAPLYERIFGKDPTLGQDPIIYDIRDMDDEMSYEEKKAILNVAKWPSSDLRHLTAGDPPDLDFTAQANQKPQNQVNFTTFQTFIEPYIRAYTEEDVAFLKERPDNSVALSMPVRGNKGYRDVWASEDATGTEPPQKHFNNPNEARGSMEDMEDDLADQDTISMGPVTSRLLSLLRPAPNAARRDKDKEDHDDPDTSMVNGDDAPEPPPTAGGEDFKPATCLPPDAPRPLNVPSLDYETLEQRIHQELKYIGILEPNENLKYDAHEDDEVAARLRTLQHELHRVSRQNNIRKARVLELTEERMAMQEYSNIADDLDNQVNAAYLKRNRSLAKPNNKKGSQARPGQKGVASGVAGGRGVSDGVRALMQKRREWNEMVGPVVQYGRPEIPGDDQTIFDETSMKRLEKQEREAEAEIEGE